jgi:aspartyl-tRNA(Asn)/glutamyl-tRNA(Gln) amidotransferase subunit B
LTQYGLSDYETDIIIGDKTLADYFEDLTSQDIPPREAANWILGELLRMLKEQDKGKIPVKSKYLADLIKLIEKGKISHSAGKEVFAQLAITEKTPEEIIKEKGLTQISETAEIEKIIQDVLSQNPDAVEDFKQGNTKVIGFLMGQIMKVSKGRANPNMARRLLEKRI